MPMYGLPSGASGKELACQCRRHRRHGFDSWVGKIPWRRTWQPSLVFLPGKSHGQTRLVGYSPWGRKELAMTEATEPKLSLLEREAGCTSSTAPSRKPPWSFHSPSGCLDIIPFTECLSSSCLVNSPLAQETIQRNAH